MLTVGTPPTAPSLQFGAVTLIPSERLVLKDGKTLPLTPKAFDLLAVLASSPGRLLTKEHLMQALWPDTAVEEANLAYHVSAIRKALGENGDGDRYIETVPRRGYRFIAPVARIEGNSRAIEPGGEAPHSAAAPAQPRRILRPWLTLAAGVALGALMFLGLGLLRTRPLIAPASMHFQEPVTGHLAESGTFAVSPDGRHLVFAADAADGMMRLWLRTFSALQPVPLPGADVFTIVPPMVWSPDSRSIVFDATGTLKKVSLDGGAPQTVCDLPGTAVGGSWNEADDILLGNAFGGLIRCPAAGGRSEIVTIPSGKEPEVHVFPSFLSDGRHFIYLSVARSNPESSGIYVGEIGSPSPVGTRLITTGFGAAFVPATDSGPGVVVFARDGVLFAQRFDERRFALTGNPIRVAASIGSYLDGAFFSVSATVLVHRAPEPDFQITWFDRQGRELGQVGTPGQFSALALSPDGTRALVTTHAPVGTVDQDVWLFDLARTAAPRRMTLQPTIEGNPVWLTNERFAFGSRGGESGVYLQTIGGQPQVLFKSGRPEVLSSMSADGRIALYTSPAVTATRADVWVRTGEGASASVKPFLNREHDESQAQLSPDGRWVAYVSNEAGPSELFVTEFRAELRTGTAVPGESIRVSEGGGTAPRWRRDGRELFYLTPDGSVMSIDVDVNGGFRANAAKRLFKAPGVLTEWGVTPDGARFLFAMPASPPPPFDIVRDWQTMLRQ